MTDYGGSTASETLSSTNWNYSWTRFFMNDGDDEVRTPSTGVAYKFYGQNGADLFVGDTASDTAYGGAHNDDLSGFRGDDFLRGESGDDSLYGGTGRDDLVGGKGHDRLDGGADNDTLSGGDGNDQLFGEGGADRVYGGSGTDTFHFRRNDSNSKNGQADIIYDWNRNYDYLDTSIAGTVSNYAEAASGVTTISAARNKVEDSSTLSAKDLVFIYNAAKDIGFLLCDLDRNYTFETGVILKGAGSASDMRFSDIV